MKAIVQREFGPADVLVLEETERPEPGPGQVLVKVRAAGVHAVDASIREGQGPPTLPPPRLPMTPGREVSGTVEAVGPDVAGKWTGKRIVAHVGFLSGGYAEYALAPAASLHELPDGVSYASAVAAIGTGRTAQLARAKVSSGPEDTVIVTGASGGLGNQLAYLALAAGSRAVALYGGDAKREAVAEISAKDGSRPVLVDTSAEDWVERLREAVGEKGATVVYDGVGGPVARACFEALGRGGSHLVYGWSSGTPIEATAQEIIERGVTLGSPLGAPIAEMRALETLALEAVERGDVFPAVTEFPLADAAAAHLAIETRTSRGKVVLVPG
ncbi:alcohol dehydrogenase catalytic domain-containing protein [Actinocorallia sp. A-T 12471]|uniref:alcohol dehydrogenase catalytic domain-containing protein n=1 Tax=Actinocorallia sp. A-T 12471 TaxID=3089813 RepID=UPI0029CC40FD|nr:zinc-binding dehydrogenase [Actinocorallia sp. A-T 12471]MDX6742472.1 zinc-binding dehydrogenase [Actinocorallia sp. A-T 12471]